MRLEYAPLNPASLVWQLPPFRRLFNRHLLRSNKTSSAASRSPTHLLTQRAFDTAAGLDGGSSGYARERPFAKAGEDFVPSFMTPANEPTTSVTREGFPLARKRLRLWPVGSVGASYQ
jgi:hypothetical protein